MSNSAWLIYTGVTTGIIGAVTGIAGAIMGFVGYRRSQQMKALDLRLDLRKALSDLHVEVQQLPPLMTLAKGSQSAVAAAIGHFGSGRFQQWVKDWEADWVSLQSLQRELPSSDETYASASTADLESRHVALHALRAGASRLREKYASALAADDRERDHIREDNRVVTQSMLQGKGA